MKTATAQHRAPERQRSIPPNLRDAVFELAARGEGQREIAARLKAEHGITTSHTSVGRLLRARAERGRTEETVPGLHPGLEELRAELRARGDAVAAGE